MDGNGVAGEGIHRQHVELLIGFLSQRQACVSHGDVDPGASVAEIGKPCAGNRHDQRIDFVETEVVAGVAVGCKGSRTESYYAYAFWRSGEVVQCLSHPGTLGVIGGGQKALGRVQELRAVLDLAVIESAVRLLEPI